MSFWQSSPWSIGAAIALASYAIGSIPFGYLLARCIYKIDIRQHGSGNIGATNVGRVLGGKWGAAVLGLDLIKGLIPAGVLAAALAPADDPWLVHWKVVAGISAILGHMFPCWLGFRGGKGVATSLGVVICLGGWATAAAAAVFALTFAATRIMSASSMAAALTFAVCQMVLLAPAPFSADTWSLAALSLLAPALIIARHRSNIGRLLRGEESRYSFGAGPPGNPDAGNSNDRPKGQS
jgi:acyl phosphate:glycerol-3-phosphate acyltransferase